MIILIIDAFYIIHLIFKIIFTNYLFEKEIHRIHWHPSCKIYKNTVREKCVQDKTNNSVRLAQIFPRFKWDVISLKAPRWPACDLWKKVRRINVFSHSERSRHHIEVSGGQQLLKTQYQSVANKLLPVYVDLSLYPSTHIYLYDVCFNSEKE